jgi:hypothetical protein
MDERIDALCIEYLFYCYHMDGHVETQEEYKYMSAQRTLVHDELLSLTGLTRENTHMPSWARERLQERRKP